MFNCSCLIIFEMFMLMKTMKTNIKQYKMNRSDRYLYFGGLFIVLMCIFLLNIEFNFAKITMNGEGVAMGTQTLPW